MRASMIDRKELFCNLKYVVSVETNCCRPKAKYMRRPKLGLITDHAAVVSERLVYKNRHVQEVSGLE